MPSITQCAVIRSNVFFCRNISKWSRLPFLAIVAKGRFVTGILVLSERRMCAQLCSVLNFQIPQNRTTNRPTMFSKTFFLSKPLAILVSLQISLLFRKKFFFPMPFFQEQIIPETSLTDCPITCLIPQELFSVENLLKNLYHNAHFFN